MNLRKMVAVLAALWMTTYASITLAKPVAKAPESILSIADIHFNPFAECEFSVQPCAMVKELRGADYQAWDAIFANRNSVSLGEVKHDTNYFLFKSLLVKLQNVTEKEHPQYGLVLGDFLGHAFHLKYIAYSHDISQKGYQEFVKKTLQFLTAQMHIALPNLTLYFVVGNNDSYTGNYGVEAHGNFYRDMANIWSSVIVSSTQQKQFLTQFPRGGYYALNPMGENSFRLIVLNSVFFAKQASGSDIDVAAKDELNWLHGELTGAVKNKQRVLLVMHIPPGIDVFKTIKLPFSKTTMFLQEKWNEAVLNELDLFAPNITQLLTAHIHMDSFQMISGKEHIALANSFTPAVSPIYGNNPAFKLYTYAADKLEFLNFTTYYLPLATEENPEWREEYNFNVEFQPDCKLCNLKSGMQDIVKHPRLIPAFKKFYGVTNSIMVPINQYKWQRYYWCDFAALTQGAYEKCIHSN